MGKDNLCAFYVLTIITLTLSVVGVINHYYIDISAQESNQNQTMTLALRTLVQDGSPFIGNLSAPITVIDFSDFQCYLCNRYVQNTEPQINETYIQTGKAVLVFKHLPNRGFDSMGAASCSTNVLMTKESFGNIINYFIVTKNLLIQDG